MSTRPTLKPALHGFLAAVLLSGTTALGQGTELPDLAKLKLAAEAGDPIAQFIYGERISASNPKGGRIRGQAMWFVAGERQKARPASPANLCGD